MNLASRIQNMIETAIVLKDKRENYNEAKKLQKRLDEIKESEQILSEQVEQLKLFRQVNLDLITVPEKLKLANKSLSKIKERFLKDTKESSLTKGRDWENLKGFIKDISNDVYKQLYNRWKIYVQECYTGKKPQDLRNVLAPTEKNNKVLIKYESEHKEFQHYLRKNLPVDIDDFGKVKEIAASLSEIHTEFDLDVPESVNHFLKSVASNGASLDLLTEEVLKWLKSNNTYSQYKIVGRH